MTNPADTTHVRFAALQNLCNKVLMLSKYMKQYPETDEQKETRENCGMRMTVNAFNYCQLVYLRDTYRVSDMVISNYTDTMLALCPETVKVSKKMASLAMTMGFARYDNRYGEPLLYAQKLKTAMETDIAEIRASEYKMCGIHEEGLDLAKLADKMTDAQRKINERLAELWKAEAELRQLEHAQVFMCVEGVDASEREPKRVRR